ncbi:hypothetical protein [Kozakia baliensis]|nr:hypothetical protein [Kozakia baliensis]
MMSPIDPLKNALPSLEQATQFRPLFLLTSFVVFLDCSSLYCYGKNILHLSGSPDMNLQRLAVPALLALILFGFFLSVIVRLAKILADQIVIATAWRIWLHIEREFLSSEHERVRFYYNTVPLGAIKAKAHKTKESYYLSLWKEAEERHREYEALSEDTALGAFSVIVLTILDVSGCFAKQEPGVISQIFTASGPYGQVMFCLVSMVLISCAFLPIFADRSTQVYCPELAEEMNAARRQQ